jgi:hypothetical protein
MRTHAMPTDTTPNFRTFTLEDTIGAPGEELDELLFDDEDIPPYACPYCNGTGIVGAKWCDACNGSGQECV